MQKFKNYLYTNRVEIIILLSITLFGFYLRLIGLDKPEGLWYDEITTYCTANASFPFGILSNLKTDFHAPLYYLILNLLMNIFGNQDIVLRFISVASGVLFIPVMYLMSKNLFDKKTGYVTAILACINSFLIFYSQEVRFYGLLALLGAISGLFIIKIKNNPSKLNFLGLILVNTIILYTATIGSLFIFLEAIIFGIYLLFKKNKSLKPFIIAQIIILLAYFPYLQTFYYHFKIADTNKIAFLNWTYTSYLIIPELISHLFSPVTLFWQHYILNKPDLLIFYSVFDFFPMIFCIYAIIKSIQKKNFSNLLFLIGFLYILVEIILALNGRMTLFAKYTSVAFPLILLSLGHGIALVYEKFTFKIAFSSLICLTLFIQIFTPLGPQKNLKASGFKYAANLLNEVHLTKKDILISPYGEKIIDKYYPVDKVNLLPFNLDEVFLYNKSNSLENVFDKKIISNLNKSNSYDLLKSYLADPNPSKPFTQYIKTNVIDKLGKDAVVAVIILKYEEYDHKKFVLITNSKQYKKYPLMPMLFAKTSRDILTINSQYLSEVAVTKYKNWELHIFKKKLI